jgi:phage recombination protein Bet
MTNVATLPSAAGFTPAQLSLIRRTVAADTNADEFDLFVAAARHAGLDPFRRQISAIVFSKDNPSKRKMSIIVNIDGFRVIAARSGNYRPDDREPAYVFDAELKSPENPKGLVSASVRVFKRDQSGEWFPCVGIAHWDEFAPIKDEWADRQRTGRKIVDGNWARMPLVMLAKCAEAQALRRAFPDAFSGLYAEDEMDKHMAETTASEMVEAHARDMRVARIGGKAILLSMSPGAPLESVPLGQVADRIVEAMSNMRDPRQVATFQANNAEPLKQFWSESPGDALEVKRLIEARKAELEAAQ